MLKIRFTRQRMTTDDGIEVFDTEKPRAGLFLSHADVAALLMGNGLEVDLNELLELGSNEPVVIGLFLGGSDDDETVANLKAQGASMVKAPPAGGAAEDDETAEAAAESDDSGQEDA